MTWRLIMSILSPLEMFAGADRMYVPMWHRGHNHRSPPTNLKTQRWEVKPQHGPQQAARGVENGLVVDNGGQRQ